MINIRNLATDAETVYQIQPSGSTSCIMEVGEFSCPNDVYIGGFNITNQQKCAILSKIYTIKMLKKIEEKCRLGIVSLQIYKNNELEFSIDFTFNTFEHIQDHKSIVKYLSTDSDKKQLKGFYSTILYKKDGSSNVIENIDKYVDMDTIIEKLISYLHYEEIKKLLL